MEIFIRKLKYITIIGMVVIIISCEKESPKDPNDNAPINVGLKGGPDLTGYTVMRNYDFGTGDSNTVTSDTQLIADFFYYGIAGSTVINKEWQRYKPFNSTNYVFTENDLELTAVANQGEIRAGGISSGQICTRETFYPNGDTILVFQIKAKIPDETGAWPAFWMYAKSTPANESEIDIFEFFDSPHQDTRDWTGFDHGPGVGSNYYNIMTNQYVWRSGFNFADDYHVYTLFWKEGNIQKWVDTTMVKGTYFDWIMGSNPQVIINLAMGGSINIDPVEASFPCKFQVDAFRVYYKPEGELPAVPEK